MYKVLPKTNCEDSLHRVEDGNYTMGSNYIEHYTREKYSLRKVKS